MRNLGTLGENFLKTWCSQVGLTATKPEEDKFGWDFYIEYPSKSIESVHDIHQAANEIKLQVKSTDTDRRNIQITLSNLRRLATAPIPAFVILIVFNGRNSPSQAFLRHIDSELVTDILKRVHDAECARLPLNKSKMTIHFEEEHEMSSLDGKGLREKVEGYIGGELSDYIDQKTNHLETTGFESGNMEANFTVSGKDATEKLVDLLIGVRSDLEVDEMSFQEQRFEKVKPSTKKSYTGGYISATPTPIDGVTKLEIETPEKCIDFDCKVFVASAFFSAPEHLKKVRIETRYFELIINFGLKKATFTSLITDCERYKLDEWSDLLSFHCAMAQKPNRTQIKLKGDKIPDFRFAINESISLDHLSETQLNTIKTVSKIATEFDLLGRISLSLYEIVQNAQQFEQLLEVFAAKTGNYRVEFTNESQDYMPENETACVISVSSYLGETLVSLIIALIGYSERIRGERFMLTRDHATIEHKLSSNISNQESLERHMKKLRNSCEIASKRYIEDYQTFVLMPEAADPKEKLR